MHVCDPLCRVSCSQVVTGHRRGLYPSGRQPYRPPSGVWSTVWMKLPGRWRRRCDRSSRAEWVSSVWGWTGLAPNGSMKAEHFPQFDYGHICTGFTGLPAPPVCTALDVCGAHAIISRSQVAEASVPICRKSRLIALLLGASCPFVCLHGKVWTGRAAAQKGGAGEEANLHHHHHRRNLNSTATV